MNPPADDNDLRPEKLEQDKEGGALFHCGLYDADIVRRISEEFLPGLASACVDNTTGGIFRSPASVAVDIRREMIDYLRQRSENLVAESVVLDAGLNGHISDDPYEIISDFVDDFASSKRNFFSRVSGWLLSERREDKIDDFVQEMETNSFWLLNRRESIAQTILKNVDFKALFHCTMSFRSVEEMEEHKSSCGFRTIICPNEGCNSTFSASQNMNHDSICPFKILKCEQNCDSLIMRREMDRHCITVCSMKLMKCPFHSVGCNSSVPKCNIVQHRNDDIESHLILVLQYFHKEASLEDLHFRVKELVELSSIGKLASARDARSLTSAVKDLEARLGPFKVNTTENKTGDSIEANEADVFTENSLKENTEIPDGGAECSDAPNSVSSDITPSMEESISENENKANTEIAFVSSAGETGCSEVPNSGVQDESICEKENKANDALDDSNGSSSSDEKNGIDRSDEVKNDEIVVDRRESIGSSPSDDQRGFVASDETENSYKNLSSEETTKMHS